MLHEIDPASHRAAHDQAKGQHASAEAKVATAMAEADRYGDLVKIDAFREVSDALAQRGTIETQLDAQRDLTASAAKSYQLSDARYQRGADSYLNTLIAQRTLYAARQTLAAARQARATNLVTLYTALGGGLGPAAAPVP